MLNSYRRFLKVKYANEKVNTLRICIIASTVIMVFAVIDIIALHRTLVGILSKIPAILIVALIIYYGRKVQMEHINNIKRHENIVKNGTRCEGVILSIQQHETYDSSSGRTGISYSLIAEYFSESEKKNKQVASAILVNTPNDIVGNKCIVYEYDGESLIDEVEGYGRKHMSAREWGLLLIVLIGFGIALYCCLK